MKSKTNGKPWIKWSETVGAMAVLALPFLGLPKASGQNIQPIYSFPQGPVTPYAALVAGPDGNLYGTTWAGGTGGEGTVFKITTNGLMTVVYSFSPPTATAGSLVTNVDGAQPESTLVLGPDGNFYGTTWRGGPGGDGTVFKVASSGGLTTLASFFGTNGANPETGLTLGPDGNFYGTTDGGGGNGYGTIFKVTTNGAFTMLHSFTALKSDNVTGDDTNADGASPYGGLTLGPDGNLYGVTTQGGSGGSGTLFKVTTTGALTNVYTFSATGYNASSSGLPDTNADGESPSATLTLGPDGNFYGTTHSGGTSGGGTVFKVTTNGAFTTLHSFGPARMNYLGENLAYTNADGIYPYASLTLGPNGAFYGTASRGGSSGVGTLFEITMGGAFTSLLTFTNGNGANPEGALILTNGIFYGTTGEGGSSGNGSVFAVTTNGALTTLYNFADANGAIPYAGLTLGPIGNFYGTTYEGGTNGVGITVEVDGYGTMFEVTTNGGLSTLVNFGGTNGANPAGSLIRGTNGKFYGTTANGGADDYGTVFEVGTNGAFTTLHAFTCGADGANPYAGLTLGTNGNFYGTSAYGGTDQWGTVFEITPNGGFTALYSFTDGSDGATPFAPLTLRPNGNFYGTTAGDDSSTYGTVFEITPNGVLTALHSFTDGNDGGSPSALTLGPDGNFYGTTYAGATMAEVGTVFEVTSNGAFATLVSFAGTNGMYPKGGLVLGPDGNFYGTTSNGGDDGIGELYRLKLPPEIIQQPASQAATTGALVSLSVTLFGTGPYSFQWLSNNIPILTATNSALIIPTFTAGDAADYSVVVSNAWGVTTSLGATLTVAAAPVITSVTLAVNGNVILDCQGQANVESRLWATTNQAVVADWTPILTNAITSANGAWQFTDTNLFQQRYYRVSTP